MSLNLEALRGLKLKSVEKKSNSVKTVKLPDGLKLRVFKDGRIYPSAELAEKYQLQYEPKEENVDPISGEVSTTIPGNGLDFFSSHDWDQLGDNRGDIIFGAFIPRGNKVISIWGSSKFDADGNPTSDVFKQGVAAKVKDELVPMLNTMYNVSWDKGYVDLTFAWDVQMQSEDGLYQIPKHKITGTKKGQLYMQHRENIEIFPMIMADPSDIVPPKPGQVGERLPVDDEQPEPESKHVEFSEEQLEAIAKEEFLGEEDVMDTNANEHLM
jgi:hypothetical protein